MPFSTTAQLSLSKFLTGSHKFYNHAFAVLEVAPEGITASYYEYPSWGSNNAPPRDPPIGRPLFRERLDPMR